MKPGLRGRYTVQSPKSRVDINSIGKLMRIPCSTAVVRAASLVPGRKADTCREPVSTARANAVLNAGPSASARRDGERSDVAGGTDIGITDAIFSGIKADDLSSSSR
jgi:hypothetical protein